MEEKEGEDQDDSLHVDAISHSKKMIKVSQIDNTVASDAAQQNEEEIK